MSKFTIGTDPEFFLRNKLTGELVSAVPYVQGTKYEPQLLPAGGNIQRDNVAVEVATDPAANMESFIEAIRSVLTEAIKVLPKETEIIAIPSATFNPEELKSPEAMEFGCDPDYDAWAKKINEKPCAKDVTFRSCGAHIHVGTTGEDENAFLTTFDGKLTTVKVMDCIHGVLATILDSGQEAIDRRKLYGKAGAHRPTSYGVEYRVLSNFWLRSPVTVMLMWSLTNDTLDIIRDGKADALIDALGSENVQRVINEGDTTTAMRMVEQTILPMLSNDSRFYFNEALAKVRANDMDFHGEWKLYGKEGK